MRDLYANHAAALRDALRHSVERGGMSSLGVLHQGVPSASTLTGTDATVQAARVRRQLDRLTPLPLVCVILFLRMASRSGSCRCIGNRFALRSIAENCSFGGRLRQFCKFADTSRTWPI
ncbi:hypothetical protein PQQ51_34305 [Paraburkholderia xenovorans]|uniref:hypothetical protein n=1 Tax=Paraburkholderia xenovorans TaxID=36873 RepID=UPI0038BBFD04